jgi:Protein of unknown function (DUF3999)
MMKTGNWLVAIISLLTIATGVAGARASQGPDSDPASYRLRLPLTLVGDAPVQRVTLPAQALLASQSSEGSDVRVFDGKGRIVPIARMPALPAPSREVSVAALPILGPRSALNDEGVSLRIDQQGRVRIITVDGKTINADAATNVIANLLDTRGQVTDVERVVLGVVLPAGQPVTLSVEASEDLKSWRTTGEAVIYRPPGAAGQARDEAIAVRGTLLGTTQLRVTWRSESSLLGPVEIRKAVLIARDAAPGTTRIVAARMSRLADRYALDFEVPFNAPIASLAVAATGGEGLIPITILGRNTLEEPWVSLGQGRAEANAQAVTLRGQPTRTIRIEADSRTSGFAAPPLIRFAINSHEIAFVASGAPPFTLAVGHPSARDVLLPFEAIAPTGAADIPQASIADPAGTTLTLEPIAHQGVSKRSLVLWAILLASTALLATITWQLWSRRRMDTQAG